MLLLRAQVIVVMNVVKATTLELGLTEVWESKED
jgi:hypothetical protein